MKHRRQIGVSTYWGSFAQYLYMRQERHSGEMQEGELRSTKADDPETLQDMPALCNRIGVQLLDITEECRRI